MAVPKIKASGPLNLRAHLFTYFKQALIDVDNHEEFPMFNQTITGNRVRLMNSDVGGTSARLLTIRPWVFDAGVKTMPITRGDLYKYFESYSRSGSNGKDEYLPDFNIITGMFATLQTNTFLYSQSSLNNLWSYKQVNDWGRMKTIELALFGDVKNGSGLTDQSLSTFNGKTVRQAMQDSTMCSLFYLRCALKHFTSYGSNTFNGTLNRNNITISGLALNSDRTFRFNKHASFPDNVSYEYAVNSNSNYLPVSSNTAQSISDPDQVPAGSLKVRLASDDIYPAGPILSSTFVIPADTYRVEVRNLVRILAGSITFSTNVATLGGTTVPTTLNFSVTAIIRSSVGQLQINNHNILLAANTQSTSASSTYNVNWFYNKPVFIDDLHVYVSPTVVNGISVEIVEHNTVM